MKVIIGVDPHKGSIAAAAIDEAKGELLERASFPQDRAGLRALERWAKRFSERREDLVAERTRALKRLHGLLRDLLPGGVSGKLSADRVARASCAAYGPGAAVGLRGAA